MLVSEYYSAHTENLLQELSSYSLKDPFELLQIYKQSRISLPSYRLFASWFFDIEYLSVIQFYTEMNYRSRILAKIEVEKYMIRQQVVGIDLCHTLASWAYSTVVFDNVLGLIRAEGRYRAAASQLGMIL